MGMATRGDDLHCDEDLSTERKRTPERSPSYEPHPARRRICLFPGSRSSQVFEDEEELMEEPAAAWSSPYSPGAAAPLPPLPRAVLPAARAPSSPHGLLARLQQSEASCAPGRFEGDDSAEAMKIGVPREQLMAFRRLRIMQSQPDPSLCSMSVQFNASLSTDRGNIVTLMHEIWENEWSGENEESHGLAVSLLERYYLAKAKTPVRQGDFAAPWEADPEPPPEVLAISCTRLAHVFLETSVPSLVDFSQGQYGRSLVFRYAHRGYTDWKEVKHRLILTERHVLNVLDWRLHGRPTPRRALELMSVILGASDHEDKLLDSAKDFIHEASFDSRSIRYPPLVIAAAALLFGHGSVYDPAGRDTTNPNPWLAPLCELSGAPVDTLVRCLALGDPSTREEEDSEFDVYSGAWDSQCPSPRPYSPIESYDGRELVTPCVQDPTSCSSDADASLPSPPERNDRVPPRRAERVMRSSSGCALV